MIKIMISAVFHVSPAFVSRLLLSMWQILGSSQSRWKNCRLGDKQSKSRSQVRGFSFSTIPGPRTWGI